MATPGDLEQVRAENEELRGQLAEAKEALRAIRHGEVDALVVQTQEGDRVFTLESAYEPYRVFLEHMNRGAAALTADGVIIFANARFAEILGVAPGKLLGASIFELTEAAHHRTFETLLAPTGPPRRDAQMVMATAAGREVPAHVDVTALPDGTRCMVISDLTNQIRQLRLLASEQWLRVTLTSIGDGVLCCDVAGFVTFLNPVAETLTGWSEQEALGQPLQRVFHIINELSHEPGDDLVGRVLTHGDAITIADAVLVRRDGHEVAIEDSAAPIRDAEGTLTGAVIVFHDVTERRRVQKALRDSETRLAEANRAKDEFLATLSHELRTPLTAILGWAQMLTTRQLDSETTARGLQAIMRNAQAQSELVTDVLDLSRIVSGKVRLAMKSIDLVAVVYAAMDAVTPAAVAKGISLVPWIQATPTLASGDPDRLQQVVWNLLSNAVKFTPAGGEIHVALERNASEFVFSVRDTGVGIDPAFLPHVFERFAQADTSTRRRHGGLGLGLAIVRHLVELHGGTVEARSDGAGKGAVFIIRLPIQAEADAPPEPSGDWPLDAVTLPSLAGARILIVDDEADTRDVLATVLRDRGADVVLAASAAEGLAHLRRTGFDVLLADIGMPIEDGYEFIRKVRALPDASGRSLPAVAVTAYGRGDDVAQATASGFDVHLAKPVSPGTLVTTVARLIGDARLAD